MTKLPIKGLIYACPDDPELVEIGGDFQYSLRIQVSIDNGKSLIDKHLVLDTLENALEMQKIVNYSKEPKVVHFYDAEIFEPEELDGIS